MACFPTKIIMINTIYLAGGCYWGVQKYLDNIRGVVKTTVGYANGDPAFVDPSYEQVRYENTGHTEAVKVEYDTDVVPTLALLRLFYRIIDHPLKGTTKKPENPGAKEDFLADLSIFVIGNKDSGCSNQINRENISKTSQHTK